MANFKTHIGWGVFLAIGVIVFSLIYSVASDPELFFWIFLAVIIGSFLPDLDMDEGVPFQMLFGLLGAGAAGLIFFNLYQGGERQIKILVGLSALIFVVVRFVGGFIFERFTNHRGMFHSIPAIVLSGLATLWILRLSSFSQSSQILISLSVSVGYLGHLVLDEIYSSVNLHGHSLFPKQSLGSALKLRSSSVLATIFFYGMIFVLALSLKIV